jgi:hypothetical protein
MYPPPYDTTIYYVRNEMTGVVTKHSAVVPQLPYDRLGGTVYAFATEAEYLEYQCAKAAQPADDSA